MSKKKKAAREASPQQEQQQQEDEGADKANAASTSTGDDSSRGEGGTDEEGPKPPPPTRPQHEQRDQETKSSQATLRLVLTAAALLLVASLFLPSTTKTKSLVVLPFRLAFSLPRVVLRSILRTINALVISPRWWMASLEVLVLASFHSRSVLCTLLLTHPICWFLSSFATAWAGLCGSFATVAVFFCVAVFLSDGGDGGFSAGEEAEQREKAERQLRTATRVSFATPLAWGTVMAMMNGGSGRGVLARGTGVVVAGWLWKRYVFARSSYPTASENRERRQDPKPPPGFSSWEQWREEQKRWRAAAGAAAAAAASEASMTTNHLPGVAPDGSTGEVRRVLSARSYYEVLGLPKGSVGVDGGGDDAVRRKWREVVRRVHPDRSSSGDEAASEAFRLATEAYEALRDAESRRRYERALFG